MRNISKEMSRISEERIVTRMKCKFLILFVVAAMATLLSPPLASAAPILSDALASFAVLGATSVTNVPTSTIFGNVGVFAGSSITGFTAAVPGAPTPDATGQVTGGLLHAATVLAAQAQVDLDAAILTLNDTTIFPNAGSLGVSINGTYGPGVYDFGAGILTGTIVLDGAGNDNAVWVFRFTSSLTTAALGSSVSVTDVGDGSNVGIYWVVKDFATLNGPLFAGNVLAQKTISSDSALTLGCGRLLSATANVTLSGDTISIGCLGSVTGGGGDNVALSGGFDQGPGNGPGGARVPEPGTMMLLGSGLVGLAGWGRKKLRK